jgi:hypothetical protein
VWSRDSEGGREGASERASEQGSRQTIITRTTKEAAAGAQKTRRSNAGGEATKKWPGKGKQSKQQKREAQPREGRGTKGVLLSSGLLQGRSTMTHFFTFFFFFFSLPISFLSP